jgi:hypothetical protein
MIPQLMRMLIVCLLIRSSPPPKSLLVTSCPHRHGVVVAVSLADLVMAETVAANIERQVSASLPSPFLPIPPPLLLHLIDIYSHRFGSIERIFLPRSQQRPQQELMKRWINFKLKRFLMIFFCLL